jgi:uncharacterized protein YndB with AHSA1/START domain
MEDTITLTLQKWQTSVGEERSHGIYTNHEPDYLLVTTDRAEQGNRHTAASHGNPILLSPLAFGLKRKGKQVTTTSMGTE